MAIKTNERPGTRAVLRHCNMSSYKVREVLDLVRGMELQRALEVLEYTERAAASVVLKLVKSAAANAEHNEGLDTSELYIATAYADEGATLKRWRPRARGRATRIRKRSCHITVILARMPDEQILRRRARSAANAAELRARRVAGARRGRNRATETGNETDAAAAFDDVVPGVDELVLDPVDTDVVENEVLEIEDDQNDLIEGDAVEDNIVEEDTDDEDAVDEAEGASSKATTDEASSEEESN